MNLRSSTVASPKTVKVVAAVLVGLGVGTLTSAEPVSLPVVGPTSALAVGGVGLAAGAVLYQWGPNLVGSPDCGCTGDCGCS